MDIDEASIRSEAESLRNENRGESKEAIAYSVVKEKSWNNGSRAWNRASITVDHAGDYLKTLEAFCHQLHMAALIASIFQPDFLDREHALLTLLPPLLDEDAEEVFREAGFDTDKEMNLNNTANFIRQVGPGVVMQNLANHVAGCVATPPGYPIWNAFQTFFDTRQAGKRVIEFMKWSKCQ